MSWRVLAVVALCAAGLLRDVSVHAWKERPLQAFAEQHRSGEDLRWVAERLPADVERVALVTDVPVGSPRALEALVDARYALSPRIVRPGLRTQFAVARVVGQGSLEEIAVRAGYHLLEARGPVALLERR